MTVRTHQQFKLVRRKDSNGWRYSAWEEAFDVPILSHGVTRRDRKGHLLGRVDTRRPPPSMMGGDGSLAERSHQVFAWQVDQCRAAYAAILAAYPEAVEGMQTRGEILMLCSPEVAIHLIARKRGRGKATLADAKPDGGGADVGPQGLGAVREPHKG